MTEQQQFGTWAEPLAIVNICIVIPSLLLFVGNRDLYPIKQREPKWAAFANLVFQLVILFYMLEKEHPEMPLWWNAIYSLSGWGIMLCLYFVRTWKLYIDTGLAHERVQNKFGWFVAHRHYRTPRFLIKLIAVLVVPQSAITALQFALSRGFDSPARDANRADFGTIMFAAIVLSYFVAFGVFGCKLRGLRDGFYIKTELSTVGIGGILCVLLWMVWALLKVSCAFPSCNVLILLIAADWMFFWSVLFPLSIAMRDPHFAIIKMVKPLRSRHLTSESSKVSSKNEQAEVSDYRENIVDIKPDELPPPPPEAAPLSAEKLAKLRCISLTKFLTYPPGRDAFRAFTVLEFSVENLLFVEAVKELHTKSHTTADVRELFDRFVAESAPYQVNLPSVILQRVKARVKEEDFDVKDLEECVAHIFKVMQRDTYKRFQKTTEWQTYVRVFDVDEKHRRGKSSDGAVQAVAVSTSAETASASVTATSSAPECVVPDDADPSTRAHPLDQSSLSGESVELAPGTVASREAGE